MHRFGVAFTDILFDVPVRRTLPSNHHAESAFECKGDVAHVEEVYYSTARWDSNPEER
jgi:hypothetical protein